MIAAVIWAGLLVPVLRHWKTPTVGASLLLAVSTEALAALAATLAASEHTRWLLSAVPPLIAPVAAPRTNFMAAGSLRQESGRGEYSVTTNTP